MATCSVILRKSGKRGKLNCGHCSSTHFGKPITCKTHAVCEQFYLHKFRHTFACMHLLAGVDADGTTMARALGLGDDILLPKGHQREAEGCAGEGGRDGRWDHCAADASDRSDDPVRYSVGPVQSLPSTAGFSFAIYT